MRKHYLFWMILLLPFFKLDAQTYCTPTTGTSTTYYLKNAIFSDQGAFYYDASSHQAYVNNSATHTVTSYPGGTVKVHLEFGGSGAKALVWVDWNANGDFNDFYENPIGVSSYAIVDDQFFIPPTQAPGIYRIRVQTGTGLSATSNPCGPNTNGNFVDFSLKIDAAIPCFVPSTLTAANITNNSASISWDAPTTAPNNGYEYYYSSSNTTPDNTTSASGTSTATSASIGGLSSFTTYYYYVRSVCGTSKSAWSLRGIFKTQCDPQTAMFEDFESVLTGVTTADCWDKIGNGNPVSQNVNIGKAVFQGYELAFGYMPIKNMTLGANYSYIDMKDKTEGSNEKFTDVPNHKLMAYTKLEVPKLRSTLNVNMEFYGKRYTTSTGDQAPEFTLVNAKLSVNIVKGVNFDFGVRNLLDRDYYLSYGYPKEGRSFITALRYHF